MKAIQLITAILFFFSVNLPAIAEESITHWRSDIGIQEDGNVRIIESVTLLAEGELIKRGLNRELPVNLNLPDGRHAQVGYKIESIKRDGKEVKYITEKTNRSLLIKIYEEDVFLTKGKHTFQIDYLLSKYPFATPKGDSFLWPVTGYGWPVSIKLAEAFVKLPPMVEIGSVRHQGHTGLKIDFSTSNIVSRPREGAIHFASIDPIENGAGFAISATWPSGFIQGKQDLLSIPKLESTDEPSEDEVLLDVPGSNKEIKANDNLNPTDFSPSNFTSFHADVDIEQNGDLVINETITASHGNNFQGISRSFPDNLTIQPLTAFIGSSQASIEKKGANSWYLVSREPLKPGAHTFVFRYRLGNQVKLDDKFDLINLEIGDKTGKVALNVTTTSIRFPELMLPSSSVVTARTNQGQNAVSKTFEDRVDVRGSETTKGFLNISVKLPKGFIDE